MTQTKINIRVRSSNLNETLDILRNVIDRELGDGWDVTVDINYEDSNRNESKPPMVPNQPESSNVLESRPRSHEETERKKTSSGSTKGDLLPWFRPPVFSSHDYDAAMEAMDKEVIDD